MKLTKRTLAVVLCVLMVASVLPMGAFAKDLGTSNNDTTAAHTCSTSVLWGFDDLETGTKLSSASFDDALKAQNSAVRYKDTTYTSAQYWTAVADPSGVEGNVVLAPNNINSKGAGTDHAGDWYVNGLAFANKNSQIDNCVVTISYDIYMTARTPANNGIPLLRVYKSGGAQNSPLVIQKMANTYLTEAETTTETDIASVSVGGNAVTFKAKTWYNFKIAFNTETGETAFTVDDELIGTTKIGGWSAATVIDYLITLRSYQEDHSITAYLDDVAFALEPIVSEDTDPVNTYADLNDLTAGSITNTSLAAANGINGIFNVNGMASGWTAVTEGEGESANTYITKIGGGVSSARKPFALDPVEDLAKEPFVLSFDLRPDEKPGNAALLSINKPTTASGSDKAESRVISFWNGTSKSADLKFGQNCGSKNMPIGTIPLGSWTHVDVAVYPVYVDGLLTYYNYAIYLDGDLRLWTELSAVSADQSDAQHFDVHYASGDTFKTVTYKSTYDTKSPFMAYGNVLGSLYFLHYNATAVSLDNISVRPALSIDTFTNVDDNMADISFSALKNGALCPVCVAGETDLTVVENLGTVAEGRYTPDADGKSGLTLGLSDGTYSFLDNGVVSTALTFTPNTLEGTVVLAKLTSHTPDEVVEDILAQVVDGALVVGGETLAALEAETSYTVTVSVDKANGTYTVAVDGASANGTLTAVTPKAGVIELGTTAAQKSLVFNQDMAWETLTVLANEDADFASDSVVITRESTSADNLVLDFNDGTASGLALMGSNVAVADGALTLGVSSSGDSASLIRDVAVWHDTANLMNTWLNNDGFTVNMKLKVSADSVSTTLVSFANDEGEKTPIIIVDANGHLSMPASKINAAYTDGALDVLSTEEYVDVAIAVVGPAASGEGDVASVFVEGKYLGNVAFATKANKNLASLVFSGALSLDSLVIRGGQVRVYTDETNIITYLDADDMVWSGNNRGYGAAFGKANDGGVFSGSAFVAATEAERAYITVDENKDGGGDYTDVYLPNAICGDTTVLEAEYKNFPLTEEGATVGAIEIFRIRFYGNKITGSLFVDETNGNIYTTGAKTAGLCDSMGNPVSISSTEWTKLTAIIDGPGDNIRYAVDGNLVYCGSDMVDGVYQTRNVYRSASIYNEGTEEAGEVRIRMIMMGTQKNKVGYNSLKAYRFDDFVDFIGVQPSKTGSSVRFIAGVDMLYYAQVGFEFSRWDSEAKAFGAVRYLENENRTVYSALQADGETVTAEELGSKYMILSSLEGVDSEGIIRVRPYYTVDGDRHYGGDHIYYVSLDENAVVQLKSQFIQNFTDGVSYPGGDGYAINNYATLVNATGDFRWGGMAVRKAYSDKDPDNIGDNVMRITVEGNVSKYDTVDGVKVPLTYTNMSGRVKLAHVIPGDLTPYIGKTMTISARVYVSEMSKKVTSDKLASDGKTYLPEIVASEGALIEFGAMDDAVTSMRGVTVYYASAKGEDATFDGKTYKGIKSGEWVTLTESIEITESFISGLAKAPDYTEENGYRYPLRPAINFGNFNQGFASELYVDDVFVIFD